MGHKKELVEFLFTFIHYTCEWKIFIQCILQIMVMTHFCSANLFMARTNTFLYGQDNPFCVKGSFIKMKFIFVEYHDVDLDYFPIIENILRCFILFNWQLHYPLNIMKAFHAVCCIELLASK